MNRYSISWTVFGLWLTLFASAHIAGLLAHDGRAADVSLQELSALGGLAMLAVGVFFNVKSS